MITAKPEHYRGLLLVIIIAPKSAKALTDDESNSNFSKHFSVTHNALFLTKNFKCVREQYYVSWK